MSKLFPFAIATLLVPLLAMAAGSAGAARMKADIARVGSLACTMNQQTGESPNKQSATCLLSLFGGQEDAGSYEVTFRNFELATAMSRRFLFSVLAPTAQISGRALAGTYQGRETDSISDQIKAQHVLIGGNADAFVLELLAPANEAVGRQTEVTLKVANAS